MIRHINRIKKQHHYEMHMGCLQKLEEF